MGLSTIARQKQPCGCQLCRPAKELRHCEQLLDSKGWQLGLSVRRAGGEAEVAAGSWAVVLRPEAQAGER